MSTIDIRKHYKQWLIEQGLKAKTSKGHTSTVNEYLRRIDRICDRQYKRHNASAWNKLAKNISDRVVNIPNVQTNVPTYKISEVIDIMINRKNICKTEIARKCNTLKKYISFVDLTEDDLYSKFHQLEIISEISNKIKNNSSIKGDAKRRHMRYVKELLETGHMLDSNAYPSSVYVGLSDIEGTKKADKRPFIPFTKEELLKIFDPENDYLLSNPYAYNSYTNIYF